MKTDRAKNQERFELVKKMRQSMWTNGYDIVNDRTFDPEQVIYTFRERLDNPDLITVSVGRKMVTDEGYSADIYCRKYGTAAVFSPGNSPVPAGLFSERDVQKWHEKKQKGRV